MSITIAGTGHRPDRLGGYHDEVRDRLVDLAHAWLGRQDGVARVISGMALGWDQALAEAAHARHIPFTAAIPFEGFDAKWPDPSRGRFRDLLEVADQVEYVCEPGYAAWKMQARNEWMVDRCDLLVALWDGSPGGTANCLRYASQVGRRHVNLWASWTKYANLRVTQS